MVINIVNKINMLSSNSVQGFLHLLCTNVLGKDMNQFQLPSSLSKME